MSWFTVFLILHIMAVIVAFGPTFAFPLMGGMIAKNPGWALPLTEAMEKIEGRITLPVAAVVPFLGLVMIYSTTGTCGARSGSSLRSSCSRSPSSSDSWSNIRTRRGW